MSHPRDSELNGKVPVVNAVFVTCVCFETAVGSSGVGGPRGPRCVGSSVFVCFVFPPG